MANLQPSPSFPVMNQMGGFGFQNAMGFNLFMASNMFGLNMIPEEMYQEHIDSLFQSIVSKVYEKKVGKENAENLNPRTKSEIDTLVKDTSVAVRDFVEEVLQNRIG